MTLEFDNGGKVDERLEYVKKETQKAIRIFVEAINGSSKEQFQISFKAFTLKTTKEESEKVFDIVMTLVAIELFKQVPELVKTVTFFHSCESNESNDSHCLLLHCDKNKVPPTREEIDKELNKDNEFAVEVEKKDTLHTVVEEPVVEEPAVEEPVVVEEEPVEESVVVE